MEYVSSFERKNTSKDLRPNNEKHSNVNMFVNNFKGRQKMLGRFNFSFEKPNKRESIIAAPELKPNIHFESTTEVENGDSSIASFKDEN
ncbi:hypothetical protein QL285_071913 [Trifolium repens]|nr:hypothetical protein QL285_071913 [Trifolium repens]